MPTVSELMGGKRPLVGFDAIVECPKCHATDLTRNYHRTTHEAGCDLFEFEPKCCAFEHHCRRCRSCGFEWAERMPRVAAKETP